MWCKGKSITYQFKSMYTDITGYECTDIIVSITIFIVWYDDADDINDIY